MELSGRTVLLTGATGGLGGALADALHARGARLLLTGRRTDVLEPLAARLGARALATDLAEHGAVEALLARCGEVDVLVANAGLSASGTLSRFSPEEIERAVRVNLLAPMLLARELAGTMAARGGGHIAFVSSLSGMTGQPGASVYSATKFGLRGFAQALRPELRPEGRGRLDRAAGLHPRGGHVRRRRRERAVVPRHQQPGGRRPGDGAGDRAQPRRGGRRPAPDARHDALRVRRAADRRGVRAPGGRREGHRPDHRGSLRGAGA